MFKFIQGAILASSVLLTYGSYRVAANYLNDLEREREHYTKLSSEYSRLKRNYETLYDTYFVPYSKEVPIEEEVEHLKRNLDI